MGADELQRADDTFSYKSYLLLVRNLAEYWPRRDRPTPAWESDRVDVDPPRGPTRVTITKPARRVCLGV